MIVQDRSGRLPLLTSTNSVLTAPSRRSTGNQTPQNSRTGSPWGTSSIPSLFKTQLRGKNSSSERESNESSISLPVATPSTFRKVSSSLAHFPRAIKQGRADERAAKEQKREAEVARQASEDACYQAREERKRAIYERWEKEKWFDKGISPPMFDRSIDLGAVSDVVLKPTKYIRHNIHTERDTEISRRNLQLFTIPSDVRRKIYAFCFPEEHRSITLSPDYATKAAFGSNHFATVWSVLENVRGGLESFSFLRTDLLTYFWSEYNFHVTINCFSASLFFYPLQNVWLQEHLGKVKNLTVEIDYTTLGASSMKAAPHFTHNRENEDKQLVRIIEGIAKRPSCSSIDNLTIMCRRYKGNHPHTDAEFQERFGSEVVPYCPNYVVQHFVSMCACLHGKVCQFRVVGYDLNYTKALLHAMMGKRKIQHIIPNKPVWPVVLQNSAAGGAVIISTMTLKSNQKQGSTPKLMVKEFFAKITPRLVPRSKFGTPTEPSSTPTSRTPPFMPVLAPRPETPPLRISPPEYLPEFRKLLATLPRLSVSLIHQNNSSTAPTTSKYSTLRHPLARPSLLTRLSSPKHLTHNQPTLKRSWSIKRDESEIESEKCDSDGSPNLQITKALGVLPLTLNDQEESRSLGWDKFTHAERAQNHQVFLPTLPPSPPSLNDHPSQLLDRYIQARSSPQKMRNMSYANTDTVRSKTADFKTSTAMNYKHFGRESVNFKIAGSSRKKLMNFKRAAGEPAKPGVTAFQRLDKHAVESMIKNLKESATMKLNHGDREPESEINYRDIYATRSIISKPKGSSRGNVEPTGAKSAKFRVVELKLTCRETLTLTSTKSKRACKEIMSFKGLGLKRSIDGETASHKTAENKRASGDAPTAKAADDKRACGGTPILKAEEHERSSGDNPTVEVAEPKRASGDTPTIKAEEHECAHEDPPTIKAAEHECAGGDTPTIKAAELKHGNGVSPKQSLKRTTGDTPKLKAAELRPTVNDTSKPSLKGKSEDVSKLEATPQVLDSPIVSPQIPVQATDIRTLEQINAMNEKDPAFARGVQVMRSLGSKVQDVSLAHDGSEPASQPRGVGLGLGLSYPVMPTIANSPAIPSEPISPSSFVQEPRKLSVDQKEPARCNTSLGSANTDSGTLKMKYMTFVNKFRGRNVSNTVQAP